MFEFARKKYRIAQGENREARPEGFFRQGKDRREVSFPSKIFLIKTLGFVVASSVGYLRATTRAPTVCLPLLRLEPKRFLKVISALF